MNGPYNDYYYQTSCGEPYERKEPWISFFGSIADHIIKEIFPRTVLDAGCAKGFLVESLRDRGVEAYGIDISEYAISEVREDIKEYCKVRSIFEPLDRKYDLIINIEVMEHLNPDEGRKAIENLCNYTDDIIFSSTPSDFKEATHQNVQPPEYWAEIFARNGFIRDIDYDAGYIADHAMRFTRTKKNLAAIIRDYERKNYVQTLENRKLRELSFELNNKVSTYNQELTTLTTRIQYDKKRISTLENQLLDLQEKSASEKEIINALKHKLEERDREHLSDINKIHSLSHDLKKLEGDKSRLSDEIIAIQNSTTWTAVTTFHRYIDRLMPLGTGRRTTYNQFLAALQVFVHGGRVFPRPSILSTIPILEMSIDSFDGNLPLSLNYELTISFICPESQLNSISILTATYDRRNADIKWEIRERNENGQVIRTGVIKGECIVNNGYTKWNFRSIPRSKGKEYILKVVSSGTPSSAVWYNPGLFHAKQNLTLDGTTIKGQIGFRCFSNLVSLNPYKLWIIRNEPTEARLEEMKKECTFFSYQPKISIITPVWNTDEKWLRRAFESVLQQVYTNWELCIVDGGSTKPHVKPILEEYAKSDKRFRIHYLSENKGIAGNSNASLALATGEWIALLDHDDELAPFALFEVVKLLNQNPNIQYIYSDEDKCDENSHRKDPFFKPH